MKDGNLSLIGVEASRIQGRSHSVGAVYSPTDFQRGLVVDLLRNAPNRLGCDRNHHPLGAILATTVAFFRRSKPAGWLLVPYLGWVSFASILNFTIWCLNAGR